MFGCSIQHSQYMLFDVRCSIGTAPLKVNDSQGSHMQQCPGATSQERPAQLGNWRLPASGKRAVGDRLAARRWDSRVRLFDWFCALEGERQQALVGISGPVKSLNRKPPTQTLAAQENHYK